MKTRLKRWLLFAFIAWSHNIAIGQSTTITDLNIRFLQAAYDGDYSTVVDCIKKGVNVNVENWDGSTALMYATGNANKQMVKLLLEKGANPNAIPSNGFTALITASRYGFTDIAEMLLADTAKTDLTDTNKATALHYASLYNNDTIVFMLLRSGADPNLLTHDKTSPLSMAAINGSFEATYLLIEAGANLNTQDKQGFTPLMLASQNGAYDLVELLIKNGAEVNAKNFSGFSALSLAIINRQADIVNFLIASGANTKESNSISLNARSLAKHSGDTSIINVIRKNGVKASPFPAFRSGGYGAELNINSKSIITGVFMTQYDFKFNMVYNMGFSFRPSAKKINFAIPDVGSYQFMERRYMFNFDIGKNFQFNRNNDAGIHLGGRMLYSFGKYRGTNIPINGGFAIAPQSWFYFNIEKIQLRMGYHFNNYGEKYLSKSHFTINLVHNIVSFKNNSFNRQLKWIE
jgi:ankyrin repeat protein